MLIFEVIGVQFEQFKDEIRSEYLWFSGLKFENFEFLKDVSKF